MARPPRVLASRRRRALRPGSMGFASRHRSAARSSISSTDLRCRRENRYRSLLRQSTTEHESASSPGMHNSAARMNVMNAAHSTAAMVHENGRSELIARALRLTSSDTMSYVREVARQSAWRGRGGLNRMRLSPVSSPAVSSLCIVARHSGNYFEDKQRGERDRDQARGRLGSTDLRSRLRTTLRLESAND
jgi:hypothetical protein